MMLQAAKLARDFLDTELAQMYDDDDEFEKRFGPAIDAVDQAMDDITTFAMMEI